MVTDDQALTIDRVPTAGDMQRAVRVYMDSLRERVAAGEGLILLGPVGVGKTCALQLIMQQALVWGMHTCYVRAAELFDMLRRYGDPTMVGHRVPLVDTDEARMDLLIVDDLGWAHQTPFALSQFQRLIEYRFSTGRSVCLASNMAAEELADSSTWQRLADRLRTVCVVVDTGEIPSQREAVSLSSWEEKSDE